MRLNEHPSSLEYLHDYIRQDAKYKVSRYFQNAAFSSQKDTFAK